MKLLAEVALMPLAANWLDPEFIIHQLGNWALWGVAFIIFAECGLFSLLPGDSLLFTVGMFVSLGSITFPGMATGSVLGIVCVVLTLAAVLGNVAGYWLGRLIGPPIFKPRSGFWGKVFDPRYVTMTHEFLDKYGNRALVLARFVPFVRTFITLVAGIAKMEFRNFITYTAVGGVIWATGVTLLGFFLGQIPFIQKNIDAALLLIVLVSLLPMVVEYVMARQRKAKEGGETRPQA